MERTNQKLNDLVRVYAGDPELVEDKAWKIWKSNEAGEYWYIPEEDDEPGDENIIEGSTGEMLYMDADDAKKQWGE